MFPIPPKKDRNDESGIPPEHEEVLDKVAKKVVEKRMTVPALMFIESVKPLNFIGSQVMVFFEPIVQSLFDFKSYTVFREAIENRDNVELLMQKIEKYDASSVKLEKAYKIMKRNHMRGKSFWYRMKIWFIGYRVPTEEVREFAKKLEEKEKQKLAAKKRQDQIGKTGFDDKDKK
jgi:DNA repair photolyase